MGCLKLPYYEKEDRPNFLGLWKKSERSKSCDNYYPFGLTFNSYQRENSTENKYLYNQGTGEKTFKTERILDLGLNVDMSRDRVYDYLTGRWWQVDPKADQGGQESWSTYQYGFDNPIRYNDPYGDCIPCLTAALTAKYSALMSSMKSSSSQGAVTRLMTNSSSTIQQRAGTNSPVTPVDNKAMARIGDAKIVTDVTAKNTKTLTNEVSKDGLAAAQAVGTGIEIAGMGTPVSGVGAAINATAGALDEARQVAFEGKSGGDALIDTGVGLAIDKTFSKLGDAAKSTVGGVEKQAHDKTVSAYEFSLTNLFQWVADKITDNSREKDKK
jgi:RHS repeat-associated protein